MKNRVFRYILPLLVVFGRVFSEYYVDCDVEKIESDFEICHVDIEPRKAKENIENDFFDGLKFNRPNEFDISNELLNVLFNDFENLTYLNLNKHQLENFNNETFENGTNLKFLSLWQCSLTKIEDFVFRNLQLLETLNLGGNFISEISPNALYGLDNLKALYFHFNQIEVLHPSAFQHVPQLDNLGLGRNRIKVLDENLFEPLKKLNYLSINSNFLEKVTYSLLEHNTNLTYFDLGENQIKFLDRKILKAFKNFDFLDLTNNVCVDQLFGYSIKPNNSSKILEIILFPFCDEDFATEEFDESEDSSIPLLLGVPLLFFVIILICVFSVNFMRRRESERSKENVINLDSEVKDDRDRKDAKISNLILEYTDQSSVHGVKYLGERRRHWMEK